MRGELTSIVQTGESLVNAGSVASNSIRNKALREMNQAESVTNDAYINSLRTYNKVP